MRQIGTTALLVALSGCKIWAPDDFVFDHIDRDDDGYAAIQAGGQDCDDSRVGVHPQADEICDDGIDNNCDGVVDDFGRGSITWYIDNDGDGWGTDVESRQACPDWLTNKGWSTRLGDCDDDRPGISPDADDTDCDGDDENCDGEADDGAEQLDWYRDSDLDNFGDLEVAVTDCAQPAGYVSNASDCDDTDPGVNPAVNDVCNDSDDDCDGQIDEDEPPLDCFYDGDGDGHGTPSQSQSACACLIPWVIDSIDCNDANPVIHGAMGELCDGIDNDCDQLVDEPADIQFSDYYEDRDGDGAGNPLSTPVADCVNPSTPGMAYVDNAADCDDADEYRAPNLAEICDDRDNDCDYVVDDGLIEYPYWEDRDNDGLGDPALPADSCYTPAPVGTVTNDLDCDDTEPLIGQLTWFEDGDGDGFGVTSTATVQCEPPQPTGWVDVPRDCDDASVDVNPAMPEICNDGIDNSCTPDDDCSLDAGGFFDTTTVLLEGDFHNVRFGEQVAILPDMNGDGIRELVVSDPLIDAMADRGGAVYVYYSPFDVPQQPFQAVSRMSGQSNQAEVGSVLVATADVTGNAWPDVVIGSPAEGVVVGSGLPTGLVYVANANIGWVGLEADPGMFIIAGDTSDALGKHVAVAYDLPQPGQHSLLLGGADIAYRVPAPVASLDVDQIADATYEVPGLLTTLLTVEDQNGDGLPEVGIGHVDLLASTSFFDVVDGALTGFIDVPTSSIARYTSASAAGFSAAAKGDIDGDGIQDLVLGMPSASPGGVTRAGRAFALLGPHPAPAIPSATVEGEAILIVEGERADDACGIRVRLADVTGNDGRDDVVVACSQDEGEGRIVVVGDPFAAGPVVQMPAALGLFEGRDTTALAYRAAAGADLDDDGVPDLIVGAPGDGAVHFVSGQGL